MKPSNALVLASVTLALAACNNPDPNRTTSAPAGVNYPTAVTEPITTPSASAAPDERGPIPPNANAQAPGTNAALAFAGEQTATSAALPSKGGAPASQQQAVKAQEAAAEAPNTAIGDTAKKAEMSGGNGTGTPGAEETSANSSRHGELTAHEESTQMPQPGQANNYSSTALDKESGRPSDGSTASGAAAPKSK